MPSLFDGANTSVDTLSTAKANVTSTDNDHPAHHNDLADAVNKMQRAMPRLVHLAADAPAVVGIAYGNAGLAFPVDANVIRRFYVLIRWTSNATTTGARFALNGPALATGGLAYIERFNSTASAISTVMGVAYDTAHVVGTAANAGGANYAIIEGHILCTVAGDVQVRSAAEVASPGSVTVLAGSSILHW